MTGASSRPALEAELSGLFRAGVLERGGKVSGCWCVVDVRTGRRPTFTVLAVWTTDDGRFEAGSGSFPHCPPERLPRRVSLGVDRRWRWARLEHKVFEGLVPGMVDLAGSRTGEQALGRRKAMRRMLADMPSVPDPVTAARVVEAVEASCSVPLLRFLRRLDPEALAFLGDPRIPPGTCNGLFHALDAKVTRGVPLRVALAREPYMARAVLEAWDRGNGPLRAALEADGLRALLAPIAARALPRGCVGSLWASTDALMSLSPDDPVNVGARSSTLRDGEDHAVRMVWTVSWVPADWTPRDRAGWMAFHRCKPLFDLCLDLSCDGFVERDDVAAFVRAGGRWEAYLSRVAAACGGIDRIEPMASGVRDMSHALAAQVIAPAFALARRPDDRASPYLAARTLLLARRAVPRVLEACARWHRDLPRMEAALATLPNAHGSVGSRWPAGFPDLRLGDVTVTVLTHVSELADEGRHGTNADGTLGLSHCVGGYGAHCGVTGSRILSLRREGVRLSTAEVRLKGREVEVVQHRGVDNAEPCHRASSAMRAYVARIGAEPGLVDRAGLSPIAVPGGQGHLDVGRAGYDPQVPGNWETVRDLWARYVPRALRGLDPAALSAALRAAALNDVQWRDEPFGRGPASGAVGAGRDGEAGRVVAMQA